MSMELALQYDRMSKELMLPDYFALNTDTCLLVRLCTVVAGNALTQEIDKVGNLALNGIFSEKFLISENSSEDVSELIKCKTNVYDELQQGYTDISDITSRICDCTDALLDNLKQISKMPDLDHYHPKNESMEKDIQYRMTEAHCAPDALSMVNPELTVFTFFESHSKGDIVPSTTTLKITEIKSEVKMLEPKEAEGDRDLNKIHVAITKETKPPVLKLLPKASDHLSKEDFQNILHKPDETSKLVLTVEESENFETIAPGSSGLNQSSQEVDSSIEEICTIIEPNNAFTKDISINCDEKQRCSKTKVLWEDISVFNLEQVQGVDEKIVIDNKANNKCAHITDEPDITNASSSLPLNNTKCNRTCFSKLAAFSVKKKRSRSSPSALRAALMKGESSKETIAEQKIARSLLFSKSEQEISILSNVNEESTNSEASSSSPSTPQFTEKSSVDKHSQDVSAIVSDSKEKCAKTCKRNTISAGSKINTAPQYSKYASAKSTVKKSSMIPNKKSPIKNPMILKESTRFQSKNNRIRANPKPREDIRMAALPLHASCYKTDVLEQMQFKADVEKRSISVSAHVIDIVPENKESEAPITEKMDAVTEVMSTCSVADSAANTDMTSQDVFRSVRTVSRGTNYSISKDLKNPPHTVERCVDTSTSMTIAKASFRPIFKPYNIQFAAHERSQKDNIKNIDRDRRSDAEEEKIDRKYMTKPGVVFCKTKDSDMEMTFPMGHSAGYTNVFQREKTPEFSSNSTMVPLDNTYTEKLEKANQELENMKRQFDILKNSSGFSNSGTNRAVAPSDIKLPDRRSEVRPNVASAAIQKLISEAMTDGVDFSDRRQFVEFRKKVVEAKKERRVSPHRYSYRWPASLENSSKHYQCTPASPLSLTPSTENQIFKLSAEQECTSKSSVRPESFRRSSLRATHDRESKERRVSVKEEQREKLNVSLADDFLKPKKDPLLTGQRSRDRRINFPHNIYKPPSTKPDGGYVYKTRRKSNDTMANGLFSSTTSSAANDFARSSSTSHAGAFGPGSNSTTATWTSGNKIFTSIGPYSSLKTSVENIPQTPRGLHNQPGIQQMAMVITRNLHDARTFSLNKNKLERERVYSKNGQPTWEMNPLLEAEDNTFVELIFRLLYNNDATKTLKFSSENNSVSLELTSSLEGVKFNFKFFLKSTSAETMFQDVTAGVFLKLQSLINTQKQLMDIIHNKDIEIEQYKLEGAILARKHVETKKFDEISFKQEQLVQSWPSNFNDTFVEIIEKPLRINKIIEKNLGIVLDINNYPIDLGLSTPEKKDLKTIMQNDKRKRKYINKIVPSKLKYDNKDEDVVQDDADLPSTSVKLEENRKTITRKRKNIDL